MFNANEPRLSPTDIARRTAVVAAVGVVIVGLAAFFWAVSHAWVVLFAAILFAVLLDGMARLAMRWLRLPRPLGVEPKAPAAASNCSSG